MARRRGKLGDYLMVDDYSGFVEYASKLKRDYWGSYAKRPMKRNLQEIATPYSDPQPVPNYRGPDYETITPCQANVAPVFVGNTNVKTNTNNAAAQALDLFPGVGDMEIGCNFRVY